MKKLFSFIKFFSSETSSTNEPGTSLPLRQLVNQVMTGLLPRNLHQKSLIINEVEKGVLVNDKRNILFKAISRLLSTTIVYSDDNSIYVSANLSGDTTSLHITTHDNRHGRAMINRLRNLNLMTETIGGNISVTNDKVNGTTLAFAFRNQQAA